MASNYYCESMFKMFHNLKNDKVLCDVTILLGRKQYPVHKVILAAASVYFKILFTAEMKERIQNEVSIKGVTEPAFINCMNFVYHQKFDITLDEVADLLHASCLFQLNELKERCARIIQSNIEVDNCVQLYQMSRVYDCPNIETCSKDIIMQNADKLLKDGDVISELHYDTLLMMLRSEDLDISDESVMFNSVAQWIENNQEQRKVYFCQLFELIRLPVMDMGFFTGVVCNNTHIQECQTCRKYFMTCQLYLDNGKKENLKEYQLRKRAPEILVVSSSCGVLPIKKFNAYRNGFVDCITRKGITETVDYNGVNSFCVHKSQIYMFDVVEKKRWFCYCNGKWKKLPKLTTDQVIVPHGLITLSYKDLLLLTAIEKRWEATKMIAAFNVKENKWVEFPSLNEERHAASWVCYKESVYITGGSKGSSVYHLETAERYDSESHQWKVMPCMNIGRTSHASAVYNYKIFVAGGWGKTMCLSSVETFKEGDSAWTLIKNLNMTRRSLGMFVRREKLYAFGGLRTLKSSLYETYDEESNSWTCSNRRDNDMHDCKILVL